MNFLSYFKCTLFGLSFTFSALSVSQSPSAPQPVKTSPNSPAEQLIAPYRAQYTVQRDGSDLGTGIRELTYLADNKARYSYHSAIKWFIYSDKRTETSTVKIIGETVSPLQYHYVRKSTTRDREYQWQYDIANNIAIDVLNNNTLNKALPENLQEKLSYHLQHRLSLIAQPDKKSFTYPVISTSGFIKNYEYYFDGEETLTLPYGKVNAIRLKREVKEKEKITYVWFAPQLNYLLVKLYQEKEGSEQFQVVLNDYQLTAK